MPKLLLESDNGRLRQTMVSRLLVVRRQRTQGSDVLCDRLSPSIIESLTPFGGACHIAREPWSLIGCRLKDAKMQ
jgi:hypothetical protein